MVKRAFYQLIKPLAILRVRWVQYRYKSITLKHRSNRTNSNIHALLYYQFIEYWYEREFSAWGRYHTRGYFSWRQNKRHKRFMRWMFPIKDYPQWYLAIDYHPEAVIYYKKRIFPAALTSDQIEDQLNKWRIERYEL